MSAWVEDWAIAGRQRTATCTSCKRAMQDVMFASSSSVSACGTGVVGGASVAIFEYLLRDLRYERL